MSPDDLLTRAREERAVLLGRGEVPWGEAPPLPPASVALLDWGRLVPEQPAWLAALGAVADLGDAGLALPEAAGSGPKTPIRTLAPLVNAPRRLPEGPVRTALALLVSTTIPRRRSPIRASPSSTRLGGSGGPASTGPCRPRPWLASASRSCASARPIRCTRSWPRRGPGVSRPGS